MTAKTAKSALGKYNSNRARLMDILWAVQDGDGYVDKDAVAALARGLKISPHEVEETRSFYHFFRSKPGGRYNIYLNSDVAARMNGYDAVLKAFETHCGCTLGSVDPTGTFGLFDTPCMGMSDQEVAALINFVPFTRLTPDRVAGIVAELKKGKQPQELVTQPGDGNNKKIGAMVCNNIRNQGPVFTAEAAAGTGLAGLFKLSPEQVIEEVNASGLRGRGGAGFRTGMKWKFCRQAATKSGKKPYILCNADEGEPGTFKDRILLTEFPLLLVEGMVAAGYALGAEEGIIYLRAEYRYMLPYLEGILAECRKKPFFGVAKNLLGKNVLGHKGFNFDLRIQIGAGAYVCGEESALIESAEGKRGSPRVRPPFPVEVGYLGHPTSVNNVETLCAVPRILEKGAAWYAGFGSAETKGTKLLSVSGDCKNQGVHEVPFGITLREFLKTVGGENAFAVQVSGPSGQCVNAQKSLDRRLCHEDMAIGGSMIVFGPERKGQLLHYMRRFIDFFAEESCGVCTPCRAGNIALRDKIDRILAGFGSHADIEDIKKWGKIIMTTTRCGLGGSSPNPLLSTIREFPELYDALIKDNKDRPLHNPAFSLEHAVKEYEDITHRKVTHHA